MDYHALQRKLFSLDPSDPREDLAKLQAAAQARTTKAEATKDYIAESVEVPEGSIPLDISSISDFAKLAGVELKEKGLEDFKTAWQSGKQNYNNPQGIVGGFNAISGDTVAPSVDDEKPVKTKTNTSEPAAANTSGGTLDPKFEKEIAPYAEQLQVILSKPKFKAAFESFLNRYSPKSEAQKTPKLKPRDPSARFMQDLRKSNAMGAHRDKKKDEKSGVVKHKGKQYESIKDMLYAKLAEKK